MNTPFANLAISGLYKQRDKRIAEGIGKELASDYLIWNANLSRSLSKQLSIRLQLNNVFDVDYQNILGATMPSRWLRAGVQWNID